MSLGCDSGCGHCVSNRGFLSFCGTAAVVEAIAQYHPEPAARLPPCTTDEACAAVTTRGRNAECRFGRCVHAQVAKAMGTHGRLTFGNSSTPPLSQKMHRGRSSESSAARGTWGGSVLMNAYFSTPCTGQVQPFVWSQNTCNVNGVASFSFTCNPDNVVEYNYDHNTGCSGSPRVFTYSYDKCYNAYFMYSC